MTKLMRAAVAYDFNHPLIIENVPIPEVLPGAILVKIEVCGVCHTDLHAVNGDWPVQPVLPFIPGHEGVGTVVAIGAGVKSAREGDRVGIPWLHSACSHCEHCLSGWETLCQSQQNTGYSVNGCYAEYVLADPNYVTHLPHQLDSAAAASILCAGLTAYKGIKETDTQPGQWLVIYGIGGLGHLAIQYAKAMGLHVVAIDIYEPQLELAKQYHADLIINSSVEDPVAKIKKEIGGAHGVLITAVAANTFAKGIAMLRSHGTVSMLGLPAGGFELSIFDMVLHRKTVRGSIVGTRMDLMECLAFAAEGKVAVHYKLDKLENINSIFENMREGKIKGRVVMKV